MQRLLWFGFFSSDVYQTPLTVATARVTPPGALTQFNTPGYAAYVLMTSWFHYSATQEGILA